MPSAIGDFISQKVYNGKLKTCHANTITLPCRFVHVERGQEVRSGKSWIYRLPVHTGLRGLTFVLLHHTMPSALSLN
ncbi:hypothetical protein EDD17DRAFT_1531361, partial [Pisolithus thermaeus]